MGVVAALLRVIGAGMVLLFVGNWRLVFPIHVLLTMLIGFGVINYITVDPVVGACLVALVTVLLVGSVLRASDRREQRVFGLVTVGAGSAWVLGARFVPAEWASTAFWVDGYLILGVLFAILWSIDQRQTRSYRVNREIDAFVRNPLRQKRAGVSDLIVEHREDTFLQGRDVGWIETWTWPGAANTIDDVIKNTRKIEAERGEPENSLSVERVWDPEFKRADSNRVTAVCVRNNPLVIPNPWDGKICTDVSEEFEIAVCDDGRRLRHQLWKPGFGAQHELVSGAPGGGKSDYLRLLALHYGPHPWVAGVGADFKGGAAFLDIAEVLSGVVSDVTKGKLLMELLYLEVLRREQLVARMKWKGGLWQPSAQNPILLVLIDEVSSMLAKAGLTRDEYKRMAFIMPEIVKKARTLGIKLVIGVQDPTTESLLSRQFINMFQFFITFRLNVPGRSQFCIPALKNLVEPSSLDVDLPGSCFIDAGASQRRARPYRTQFTKEETKNQVLAHVRRSSHAPHTLDEFLIETLPPGAEDIDLERVEAARDMWRNLERIERPAITDGSSQPDGEEPVDAPAEPSSRPVPRPRGEVIDTGRPNPAAIEGGSDPGSRGFAELMALTEHHGKTTPQGRELRRAAVVALLQEEGAAGVRAVFIYKRMAMSPSWTFEALKYLREQGLVHNVGEANNGLWFPGPAPADRRADEDPDDEQETP